MIIGIDIGGTSIKFGVIDADFRVVYRESAATKTDGTDLDIVAQLKEVCLRLKAAYPVRCIGIGSPGTIDTARGICVRAGNLPYRNTPMRDFLQEAVGLPVVIANDATCAICAECYAGIGKEYRNFIMFTLGTGVGGGIVLDGKPYRGRNDSAGEFGHTLLVRDGLLCKCGRRGCLEQYASVTALIRQTREAAAQNPNSLLADRCRAGVNGQTVFDAAQAGCPVAQKVVEQYAKNISDGIHSLCRAFAPEAVVIGGGVTAQGEALLSPIRTELALPIPVCFTALGNDAGMIGAAITAAELTA